MVLLIDAVRSMTIGKSVNNAPARRHIAETLYSIPDLPKIKTCKEIIAELHHKQKPLNFYLLNGRPVLYRIEDRIKLK